MANTYIKEIEMQNGTVYEDVIFEGAPIDLEAALETRAYLPLLYVDEDNENQNTVTILNTDHIVNMDLDPKHYSKSFPDDEDFGDEEDCCDYDDYDDDDDEDYCFDCEYCDECFNDDEDDDSEEYQPTYKVHEDKEDHKGIKGLLKALDKFGAEKPKPVELPNGKMYTPKFTCIHKLGDKVYTDVYITGVCDRIEDVLSEHVTADFFRNSGYEKFICDYGAVVANAANDIIDMFDNFGWPLAIDVKEAIIEKGIQKLVAIIERAWGFGDVPFAEFSIWSEANLYETLGAEILKTLTETNELMPD